MLNANRPMFSFPGLLGVRVQVNASLLLLVIVIMMFGFAREAPLSAAIFCGMLVLSIYLHELGHAVGAKLGNVEVKRIVIHGAGGFCETERTIPRKDLLIVACGPMVNLLLWYFAMDWVDGVRAEVAAGQRPPLAAYAWYVYWFGWINLMLLALNMLPVLPLDGGRLLFLGLWYKLPMESALKVTGFFGMVVSVLWLPAIIYLFLTTGIIVLFFPSIRDNWERFRGRKAL